MLTQGHMVLTKDEQGRLTSMGATLCPIDFSAGHVKHHVVVPLGLCQFQPPTVEAAEDAIVNVCKMPVLPDALFKKALDVMSAPVLQTALDVPQVLREANDKTLPQVRHVRRFTRRRSLNKPSTSTTTTRRLRKDKPTRSD
jgi:hypothetical protein